MRHASERCVHALQDQLELLVPDEWTLEVPAVGGVDVDHQHAASGVAPDLGGLRLLDGLVLLNGLERPVLLLHLDHAVALQVDHAVETGEVRRLRLGVAGHVGQLVAPD